MSNLEVGLIGLVATLGGVFFAFMGWLDSGEPFNPRKFGKSCAAALVAGIGFGIAYTFVDGFTIKDVLIAFLAGGGFTAGAPKVIGAI